MNDIYEFWPLEVLVSFVYLNIKYFIMKRLIFILSIIPLFVFPQKAKNFYRQGIDRMMINDYQGAISSFTSAIKINPQYAEAYNDRGWAENYLHLYSKAIVDYTKAISLNMEYVESVYINRGDTKSKMKNYIGAIEDYNKAISINPASQMAYYKRGDVKRFLTDFRGSILDYNLSIKLFSYNSEPYYGKALAEYALKFYERGIIDCDSAIKYSPDWVKTGLGKNVALREAYYLKGCLHYELNDTDSACLNWSKSGQLGYVEAYNAIKKVCN